MSLPGNNRCAGAHGFTLLELLVVLAIIGLLAAVTLPAMKGMRQSNALAAANRQLLDDLAGARQRAIKDGTVVMVVFVPPADPANSGVFSPLMATTLWTNLLRRQLTHYALFAERTAGDQPGRGQPRYLAHGQVWRGLPDGMFFPEWKFKNGARVPGFDPNRDVPRFDRITGFSFPGTGGSFIQNAVVPYIAFNARGQLVQSDNVRADGVHLASGPFKLATEDAVIPLARGSIFEARNGSGNLMWDAPDTSEKPPGNSTANYNLIVVDRLTGRARIESPQIQ